MSKRPPQQPEGAYKPPYFPDGIKYGVVGIDGKLYRREDFLAWGGVDPDWDPNCPICHGTGKYGTHVVKVQGQPDCYPSYVCRCADPYWGPAGPPPLAKHTNPPAVDFYAGDTDVDKAAG